MHPFEADFIGVRHTGPFTRRAQAFMSAPFLAAIAWNTGTVSFQALHDFDNPLYGETLARVTILSDESRCRYGPSIKVAFTDGRTLEWEEIEGKGAYELTWASAVDATGRLAEESAILQERRKGREERALARGVAQEAATAPRRMGRRTRDRGAGGGGAPLAG